MEDGEIYCRGIVFSLDALGGGTETLPDFGTIYAEHQGTQLSCRALVPGMALQDLCKVFEEAEEAAGPRSSMAGNPGKWPDVQGVKAVAQAAALAVLKWKGLAP
jgi:hypothetical protein